MKQFSSILSFVSAFGAFSWTALTLSTSIAAPSLDAAWSILPGDRDYVTDNSDSATANTQRGMAFNKATSNVLLVSRAAGTELWVLDGATGEEKHFMDTIDVSGGTFPLSLIGVGDDGAVYGANLSTSTSNVNFKIYRWADDAEDTLPNVAFEGDPAGIDEETGNSLNAQRWGDSFDVIGSGVDTRILVGSRASATVAIFTTEDGENFSPTLIDGVANGSGSLGVAFDGSDAMLSTIGSAALRRAEVDVALGTVKTSQTFPPSAVATTVSPIAADAENRLLAGINLVGGPDSVLLYDISDLGTGPVLLSEVSLTIDQPNTNGVGALDFGDGKLFALDTNNGLYAFTVEDSGEVLPPELSVDLTDLRVLQGGAASFSVTAAGSPPFTFTWFKDGVAVDGVDGSQLAFAAVAEEDAGEYMVTITNDGGSIDSRSAILEVLPIVQTGTLVRAWSLSIDDRAYLSDDNAQRGMAVNSTNGNVLLVSRTGGTHLQVINGADGTDLRELNTSADLLTGGGIFVLNMVGVADDGAIYACNLTTSGNDFTIYRWADDTGNADPEIVYGPGEPGVGGRIGDTLDVRGSGADTQILAASRAGTAVAIFTTDDGTIFEPTQVDTDANAGDFGLSISFGAGDTFWGKAPSRPLRQVAFDLGDGSGLVVQSFDGVDFPDSVSIISVNPELQCLAAISLETPDNLQIYSLADPALPPLLLDQVFFTSDNANGNGVGSVDFGGNNVVALNTNNGILAATLGKSAPEKGPVSFTISKLVTVEGAPQLQFELTAPPGTYIIEKSTSFIEWDEEDDVDVVDAPLQLSYPVTDTEAYYRARPQ
ncbi:MAG: hypothetical protein ACI9R3_004361 [Verrucomicrobiales bacterium]|jgi:hypothetical protein